MAYHFDSKTFFKLAKNGHNVFFHRHHNFYFETAKNCAPQHLALSRFCESRCSKQKKRQKAKKETMAFNLVSFCFCSKFSVAHCHCWRFTVTVPRQNCALRTKLCLNFNGVFAQFECRPLCYQLFLACSQKAMKGGISIVLPLGKVTKPRQVPNT